MRHSKRSARSWENPSSGRRPYASPARPGVQGDLRRLKRGAAINHSSWPLSGTENEPFDGAKKTAETCENRCAMSGGNWYGMSSFETREIALRRNTSGRWAPNRPPGLMVQAEVERRETQTNDVR